MWTVKRLLAEIRDRRAEGYTITEIGTALGVQHSVVYKWLRGEVEPSNSVLILAEALWGGN